MAQQNAGLAILARRHTADQQHERLGALQEVLGLAELPERIECFDISHTQGEATVASCVVYAGVAMKRADYRRFNIRGVTPGDDFAAIAQAVSRRYANLASGEGRAPDLVLIDGGKGQVEAARAALADLGLPDIPLLGVAKGEARKAGLESLIFADGREPLQLPPVHPALHLIQEIRDEAHRFAVAGHRARRGKARKSSRLEDIAGIGPARRKALIASFGGLAGVRDATPDQLAEVDGISRKQAEAIHAALH
jgi:excinuclease ABC subunit C